MAYRYHGVVELIRKRVEAGTLKVGDRLPSIRQLSQMTGFSTVTVHHGYELLESQGYCEARPRSGFYLTRNPTQLSEFSKVGEGSAKPVSIQDLPEAMLLALQGRSLQAFGSPQPCEDLYDCTDIDRALRRVLRGRKLEAQDAAEGDPDLRLQIARRAAQRGIVTRYEDIIVTGSAMQAFNLCLDALTDPGDVILVESPSYFPTLAGIKRRNLKVVEIYSHPATGTDPDQFEHLVRHNRIRVALLMAIHHFPTGVTYSEDAMRRIVAIAQRNDVTIIENDTLGELGYDRPNAPSMRQMDPGEAVLQLGSFEHCLSPEYGIGWVIAGPHAGRLLAASHLGGYVTNDRRVQRALAQYLSSHSQDRHLRRIRNALATRMEHGLQILADHLSADCSVSRPSGGFMCWVRAPQRFKAREAVSLLQEHDVGLLPGPVFSATLGSFQNFFALNLSFPWTPTNEAKLIQICSLVTAGASCTQR